MIINCKCYKEVVVNMAKLKESVFLFFFIWLPWPFQDYFTYIEPIIQ